MTLEEYKIQDALGSLSLTDKEALARSLSTPKELINYIKDTSSNDWWIEWMCTFNLSIRPTEDEQRVKEKDTTI